MDKTRCSKWIFFKTLYIIIDEECVEVYKYFIFTTGLKIQESFPGRMWIALLCDFLFNTPNPVELPHAIDDAIDEFTTAGFQGNYIFLAGHSLGGIAPLYI